MRAIFFWRTTSAVDLEHLAERDGIRWGWRQIEQGARVWRVPGRTKPIPVLTDAPHPFDALPSLFVFSSRPSPLRSPVFVEEGLDAGQALAAWEKGDGR